MLTTPGPERDLIRSQNRGSRTYSIEGHSLPSVTSIVSSGEPKPALINWAKKVTAEAAVKQRTMVQQLIDSDGEQAAIDHLKGVGYRQRNAAGDIGSRLHEVCEAEVLRGEAFPDPGDPDARLMLEHFRHFVATMNPEWLAVEAIVYNLDYGYAGTLDAAAKLHPAEGDLHGLAGVPMIIDWKSGSGVYGSFALQLAAYAWADFVVGPTGATAWKNVVSREVAGVVHISVDGWKLYQVRVDSEILQAFLSVMDVAEWVGESQQAIGRVLAHGRAAPGGKAISRKQEEEAPPPEVVVANFGSRRRIQPPQLTK